MSRPLFLIEIERVRWDEFHTTGERSHEVPAALRQMLSGQSEDEVMEGYWGLENVVVVQGQLFSAALPTLEVVLAGLADDLAPDARDAALELAFQIVSGESDEEEVARGNADLGPACRRAAQQGKWLFYRELGTRRRKLAESVLELVEDDKSRLPAFLAALRGKDMPR
ncbi:hypothetical protein GL263_12815 [Streptomyces durbertensis]|uniref:Uncharacterized protein n=1 Tax=Streptomyces durbertensis TaxID=2448886 RepID=A0ABR6EGI2_9ACTN|nr:hypothetical protein [Streptomyces durbertensis]MBB1244436.1 hypothetical protein [Streptomyces durbertensis]